MFLRSLLKTTALSGLLATSLSAAHYQAHDDGIEPYKPHPQYTDYYKKASPEEVSFKDAKAESLEAWMDMGFGVFIHWDHSSQIPDAMSWGRKGARPRHPSDGKVNRGYDEQAYNDLAKTFNPTEFDATAWVKVIKDAGAKYMVFTAKHHAGFSMFDSKVSKFDIMDASPFKRDVCKELADACQKAGIKVGWYYSQPDWYQPDYADDKSYQRYVDEFLYPQIKELLTNYGHIDIMWFDGLGMSPKMWNAAKLLKMMRTLQPDLVVNHRFAHPPWRFGDFDGPEQRLGRFQINRPWETCSVIGGRWGWGGDLPPMTLKDCITSLVRTRGNGGNLLLNTGPDAKGKIIASHIERYKEMGQWLQLYGESYYATRGGPYMPGAWGSCTRSKDGKKIYLHILASFDGTLTLPNLPSKVLAAKALNGGNVKFSQSKDLLKIEVDKIDPINTVIALELETPVTGAIASVGDNLTTGAKVSASSERSGNPVSALISSSATEFSEGILIKKDWAPKPGDNKPWVEVQFKNGSQLFNQIQINYGSKYGTLVQTAPFDILYKKGDQWIKAHSSKSLNLDTGIVLKESVKTNAVRIQFGSAKAVRLKDITIFGPAK